MNDCIHNNGLQELDIDKIIELSKALLFKNDKNALYTELINIINSYFKVRSILVIEVTDKKFEVILKWKKKCGEVIFYNEDKIRGTIEQICDWSEEKIIDNGDNNFEVFYPIIHNEKLLGIVCIEKKCNYSHMELKILKLICLQVASVVERINAEESKVHKIESELRESEEGYKRLFELSPDAICVHSGGKIVLANPEAQKLFDVKNPKAIIGRNIMDFVHSDYIDIVKSRINTIYEGGMITPFIEEVFMANDGSNIEVEVGTSTFKYNNKIAVLVVARNISVRKKMQRDLKSNESLLREITENISDMIAKTDVDGTIKYITPAKNDVIGYGRDNVIGKNIFDFIHVDDRNSVKRKIRKLIRTSINLKTQFRCIHADGHIVWSDCSFNTLLDDNNKVIGLIFSARDSTKQLELNKV